MSIPIRVTIENKKRCDKPSRFVQHIGLCPKHGGKALCFFRKQRLARVFRDCLTENRLEPTSHPTVLVYILYYGYLLLFGPSEKRIGTQSHRSPDVSHVPHPGENLENLSCADRKMPPCFKKPFSIEPRPALQVVTLMMLKSNQTRRISSVPDGIEGSFTAR